MTSHRLDVVDAQVHLWDAACVPFSWPASSSRPEGGVGVSIRRQYDSESMGFEMMLERMAAAGIDAAVVVTPLVYEYDNTYAFAAHSAHPDRFRVVARIDPRRPDINDAVGALRRHPAVIASRVLAVSSNDRVVLADGGCDPLFAAAEQAGLPVCIYAPRMLPTIDRIARRFDALQLVIDHLGLAQPPLQADDPPFSDLDQVLKLSGHPNVAVKLTGLPLLSREPFPFPDLWPYVNRVIDAYGTARVMWGSDITKANGHHTLFEAVAYIRESERLSHGERATLLGQSARRIFRWPLVAPSAMAQ